MQRIDSHQHFWQLSRGDYGWLTPELGSLYRDFLPNDLKTYLEHTGVTQTILVQAADTIEESQFMLSLAQETDFIAGVVGWVEMTEQSASSHIESLARHAKFKGIRPMIQGIEDTDWMLQEALAPAFEALQKHNLCFDALVLPKHLKNLYTLAKRYPALPIVIDHGAKPNIGEAKNTPVIESINQEWAEDMRALAQLPNVYCKLSGLLTEAGEQPSYSDVLPYMEHLYQSFGANKLMWGSDWPVLNLASDYPSWFEMTLKFTQSLNADEQQAIWANTAKQFYQIK